MGPWRPLRGISLGLSGPGGPRDVSGPNDEGPELLQQASWCLEPRRGLQGADELEPSSEVNLAIGSRICDSRRAGEPRISSIFLPLACIIVDASSSQHTAMSHSCADTFLSGSRIRAAVAATGNCCYRDRVALLLQQPGSSHGFTFSDLQQRRKKSRTFIMCASGRFLYTQGSRLEKNPLYCIYIYIDLRASVDFSLEREIGIPSDYTRLSQYVRARVRDGFVYASICAREFRNQCYIYADTVHFLVAVGRGTVRKNGARGEQRCV